MKNCQIAFSQTLFNEDDEFEYVCGQYGDPKTKTVERDRDGDGFVDARDIKQEYNVTGLEVKNNSGKSLYSIDFPTGYRLDDDNAISVLDMKEYRHLIANVSDMSGVNYMLVYRIDPKHNSVEQVGEPIKSRTLLFEESDASAKDDVSECVSIIPNEYSFNRAPVVIATDYDSLSHVYAYKQYDARLENKTSSNIELRINNVLSHKEYSSKEYLRGDTVHIYYDPFMIPTWVEIEIEPGVTMRKCKELTTEEIEKYFLPTAPQTQRSIYSRPQIWTGSIPYEKYDYRPWKGTVYASFINFPYDDERFGYIGEIGRVISFPNREVFVYFLSDDGDFYKMLFNRERRWIDRRNDTLYSLDFDQIEDTVKAHAYPLLKINVINRDMGKGCSLRFSQTLFNNDEAIEYVWGKLGNSIPLVIEKDRDRDGYIDYRETIEEYPVVGLIVRSVNGGDVYTLDFPEGYRLIEGSNLDLLDLDEYRHLVAHVKDSSGEEYILIYRLNPGQSSAIQLHEPLKARSVPQNGVQ